MSIRIVIACVTSLSVMTHLPAQNTTSRRAPRYFSATVFAGTSGYDLQGLGWARSVGMRAAVGLTSSVVIEPSVMSFGYRGQTGADISYTMAEISVQLQAPTGGVRPYVGAGGGYAFARGGLARSERTVHGALGLRTSVMQHVGLVAEVRLRNLSWFRANATMLDYVGGISIVP